MSILMMVTHSVISEAVARTAAPALALAAYSAAYAVGQVLEAPCYGMQRMGLTFMRGKRSARTVLGAETAMLSAILLAYALVSWTPLATWVFRHVLGVSADIYPLAVASLRVFILWPTFSAVRSLFQPRIVLAKRTVWLSVNMIARVAVMVVLAAVLPTLLPGGPVGSVILVAGIGTEAALAFLVARALMPPLDDDPQDEPPVSAGGVFSFALPLALAASVQTVGRPVVTAALLRAANPTVTLAGFQVASSFSYIFTALTYNIYHVVVIYVKDSQSYRKMQAFCLGLGALGTVLLALCSVPPVARLVFGGMIGTPADVSQEAVRTLAVLTLSPLTAASMEFYSGILMFRRRASLVTLAKIINMASTCGIAVGVVALAPGTGGMAGAAAIVLGPLIEAGIAYGFVRRSPECGDLWRPEPAAARTVQAP
jgi:hypothetical protein